MIRGVYFKCQFKIRAQYDAIETVKSPTILDGLLISDQRG